MKKINKILIPASLIALTFYYYCLPNYTMEYSKANYPKQTSNLIKVPSAVKYTLKILPATSSRQNIRKFPYPYDSMLSLCSDIDETTLEEFETYHKFLNTYSMTQYGKGLGLDVGDTMWMYMANNVPHVVDKEGHDVNAVMTYFDGTNYQKEHNAYLIQYYYKAGWIDAMHGFGDFSRVSRKKDLKFNRTLAIEAFKALSSAGIHPSVWINHGNTANVENFGGTNSDSPSLSYQQGDNPRSPFYHTDITIKSGIKFVWDSVGGAHFGVDNPLYSIKLRDGQKVWGFKRYTYDLKPVDKKNVIDWTWTPNLISRQITRQRLNSIVKQHQYSIIAQHFGILNTAFPFDSNGISTLRLLASYQDSKKILIARTSRLLQYSLAQQYVKYNTFTYNNVKWINIISIGDPIFGSKVPTVDDLRGITFYTPNPQNTHILINLSPVSESEIQRNPSDIRQKSIGIKWFPRDTFDYTQTKYLDSMSNGNTSGNADNTDSKFSKNSIPFNKIVEDPSLVDPDAQ